MNHTCFSHTLQYIFFSGVSFLLNLCGAVFLLLMGLESSYAYTFVGDTMRGLIYRYNFDMEAKLYVDTIQESVSTEYGITTAISVCLT